MSSSTRKKYGFVLVITGGTLVLFSVAYFVLPHLLSTSYDVMSVKEVLQEVKDTVAEKLPPKPPQVLHVKTPQPVKSLYMTSCAAGTPSFRTHLLGLIDTTELNAIVIDIKDFSGTLSYIPENPALTEYISTRCVVKDMKDFVKSLHEKNVYVIGRVTVFQDPLYTKRHPATAVRTASDNTIWKDRKGISFIDPSSEEAWAHVIMIAKDAYSIGFDEINFDYIRFPSDGNMRDIAFPWTKTTPKAVALERFFKHLHDTLKGSGIITSADLFGMTATVYDDMNIGQVLEQTLPYFDYVAPMVYPSHYPPTFNGWQNPNAHPYELIKFVMTRAVERTEATSTRIKTIDGDPIASTTPQRYTKESYPASKLRTWIQDFDLGTPPYGATEVRQQIQASQDAGVDGWMRWDASNKNRQDALMALKLLFTDFYVVCL